MLVSGLITYGHQRVMLITFMPTFLSCVSTQPKQYGSTCKCILLSFSVVIHIVVAEDFNKKAVEAFFFLSMVQILRGTARRSPRHMVYR